MNSEKLSPKVIEDWCKQHPGALQKMVASYGYMCYMDAVSDLMRIASDLRQIEANAAVLLAPLNDYDNWKAGDMCRAKFDHLRMPEKTERVPMVFGDTEYVSNCCDAKIPDPNTSDVCPKCKEHCKPVLAGLDTLI